MLKWVRFTGYFLPTYLQFLKSHLLHKIFTAVLLLAYALPVTAQKNSSGFISPGALSFSETFQSLNDSVPKLRIRNVIVYGNKKTKEPIILREMELKAGDSILINNFLVVLEKDRQRIYNTTLFEKVAIEPVLINAFELDIAITVKERWYIYPLPELKFIDGNFNKWLMHYKGDLKRVDYGIKFIHYNLTGHKDRLSFRVLNGYTKTFSFNYNAPYINRALTNGFSFGVNFIKRRELAYKTSYDNDFIFYKKSNFVKTAWDVSAGYSIRKGLKLTHLFDLNFTHIKIDDSLITGNYNKSYFNKPTSTVGYVDLTYRLKYLDVNNIFYPLTGQSGNITLGKRGLGFSGGINSFYVDASVNKYWALGNKWFASTQLQGKIKLPFKQPYINQTALGYLNTYVRGLDYRIIDGVAFAISKFNVKKEILFFNINTLFKNSKTFNKIPFRVYAKTFLDMGYCYNREEFMSRLNNTFLGSAGVGIDIITFYDIQFRVEWSINQLGEKGLFLHNEKGF